jgi:hypothetical protein
MKRQTTKRGGKARREGNAEPEGPSDEAESGRPLCQLRLVLMSILTAQVTMEHYGRYVLTRVLSRAQSFMLNSIDLFIMLYIDHVYQS